MAAAPDGDCGRTRLRYNSLTERPVLVAEVVTALEEAASVDGTNCTRLRFMPAPNTRWSCSGIVYSSSEVDIVL